MITLFLLIISFSFLSIVQTIEFNTDYNIQPSWIDTGNWIPQRTVLYDSIPNIIDVKQSYYLNDCYFLAILISLANKNPGYLMQNIKLNSSVYYGEGVYVNNYQITLYYYNNHIFTPVIIQVDDKVLITQLSYPYTISAIERNVNGNFITWVMLYEKAFAKFNTITHIVTPQNGYYGIGQNGWNQGLVSLTGLNSYGYYSWNTIFNEYDLRNRLREVNKGETVSFIGFYPSSYYTKPVINCIDGSNISTTLYFYDLNSHYYTILHTFNGEKILLIADHAFSVLDSDENNVRFMNSWGYHLDVYGNSISSIITIPISSLQCALFSILVGTMPPIVNISTSDVKVNSGEKEVKKCDFICIILFISLVAVMTYNTM